MSKFLLCFDSFKDAMDANEIHDILANLLNNNNLYNKTLAMADGGEGSLLALANKENFKKISLNVENPVGKLINSYYLQDNSGNAYIELAIASGLERILPEDRNPMNTSTFGSGQLILDAIAKKNSNIYFFIGSSSTNDAGIGIANALGYQFYNNEGLIEKPTGKDLKHVSKIIKPDRSYDGIQMHVVCDVKNPMYGPNGAAYIFAKQKGASDIEIDYLDQGLEHFSQLIKKQIGIDVSRLEGGGAAGGIGAGMKAFFNANLISGFEFIAKHLDLEDAIKDADWVLTGEGKLDNQSKNGKVVLNVVTLAKKHHKKTMVICGKSEFSEGEAKHVGIDHLIELASYGAPNIVSKSNTKLQLQQAFPEIKKRIESNASN